MVSFSPLFGERDDRDSEHMVGDSRTTRMRLMSIFSTGSVFSEPAAAGGFIQREFVKYEQG